MTVEKLRVIPSGETYRVFAVLLKPLAPLRETHAISVRGKPSNCRDYRSGKFPVPQHWLLRPHNSRGILFERS